MPREIEPVFDKTLWAKVHRLRIDPEFKSLLGASSENDRLALADSIAASGCLTPLVAWPQKDGDPILLDGHRRHEICEKMGMAYRVVECPDHVTDRQSALIWIIQNQRARRNVTQNRLAYLRGKIYLAEKRGRGGDRKSDQARSNGQNDHLIGQTAAQRIAEEFNVAEKTIRRNAAFAEQVDAIAAEYGPEAREEILEGVKSVSDFVPCPEPAAKEMV